MPAIRKIQREPRSMDDLMASAERMIHQRIGTMRDVNLHNRYFTHPATAGTVVAPGLGGGDVSPLNGARVGAYQGRVYDNTTY